MTTEATTMVRQRQQETKAFEIRPSGPSLDDEEDEESKLPSRWHLAIAANQIFLIYVSVPTEPTRPPRLHGNRPKLKADPDDALRF